MLTIDHIQAQLTPFLEKHTQIACCYIFGSDNNNRLHHNSDIDIAVAGALPLSAYEKKQLREELEQIFQRDVDLVDLQQATGSILRQALHGTCILCRNKLVRYQLQRQLIYDQEDMQPLRNRMMKTRRMRFAYGNEYHQKQAR